MILCKAEYAKAIDKAVFPGMQGGPLMHVIAAKAVRFKEALDAGVQGVPAADGGQRPGAGRRRWRTRGFRLVSGGTDNHLMLVDVTQTRPDRQGRREGAGRAGITVNKNTIPFDTESPSSPAASASARRP